LSWEGWRKGSCDDPGLAPARLTSSNPTPPLSLSLPQSTLGAPQEPCDSQQGNEDQDANRKLVAIWSHQNQREKTKRKGCCQCHACGEAQGQNYGYHGSAPFLVVSILPKQRKDIRDGHHVLELFRA